MPQQCHPRSVAPPRPLTRYGVNGRPYIPIAEIIDATTLTRMAKSHVEEIKRRAIDDANGDFFYKVIILYQNTLFEPIGKVIGLTPEAALLMTLNLGQGLLSNMAASTTKPLCRYSSDENIHGYGDEREQAPPWLGIGEATCLTALYTKYCHLQCRDELITTHTAAIEMYPNILEALHETPWILRPDYHRLAHEFKLPRTRAAETVATELELGRNNWRFLEDVLFSQAKLRLHGFSPSNFDSKWKPRRIIADPNVNRLRLCCTIVSKGRYMSDELWLEVNRILFDKRGPYLHSALKRHVIRASPVETMATARLSKSEIYEYMNDMTKWILETIQL